jgi:hypothetical protein
MCPHPTDFQKIRSARTALHADLLYELLPNTCWMTEKNMADAVGVSLRDLRVAKNQLVTSGRIKITHEQNGRRANPKHIIQKVNPIKPNNTQGDHCTSINWGMFSEFRVQDINEQSRLEQVEIYQQVGLKLIPMHFPKFKRGVAYCSCPAGRNCPYIGKHPAIRWKSIDFSDRKNLSMLRAFWREKDDRFNIGFVTNSFSVLDVDNRNGGHHSLDHLQEAVGELPAELSALSGNGRHIYVQDGGILSSATNILGLPGLDIKAKGGVIVAPSSTHRTGNEYKWETLGVPEPLPESWAVILGSGVGTRSGSDLRNSSELPRELKPGDMVLEGTRNDTLFKLACRERGGGANYDAILAKLERVNANHCQPVLKRSMLTHIAKSAAKYRTEREKRR